MNLKSKCPCGFDCRAPPAELASFGSEEEAFQPTISTARQILKEGTGVVAESSGPARLTSANPTAFASLFELQLKSSAAEVLRHEQWRAASSRLDEDPSLLVHFDFEQTDLADWRLPNTSKRKNTAPDAPSSAANGSRAAGRTSMRWSFGV